MFYIISCHWRENLHYSSQNMNHVQKYSKNLVSVIINLGTNISEGDTVFYDRVKQTYLVKISHVLKHLHDRRIIGPFERLFHESFLERAQSSNILDY